MTAQFWWILQKDLISEFRTRRAWPAMLLLGVVVALVFSMQMGLLPEQKQQMLGGLLWISVYFAGMTAVDRSFASEREEGCWAGLRLLPISPSVVFLAKFSANMLALLALQVLLVPLFFLLCDVPLFANAGTMLMIAVLATPGLAAVATLVSAMASGNGRGGSLLVLVALPLVIPILLAAAECTRIAIEGQIDEAWWRWIQLLGAFAIIFTTAGIVLFEYAVED